MIERRVKWINLRNNCEKYSWTFYKSLDHNESFCSVRAYVKHKTIQCIQNMTYSWEEEGKQWLTFNFFTSKNYFISSFLQKIESQRKFLLLDFLYKTWNKELNKKIRHVHERKKTRDELAHGRIVTVTHSWRREFLQICVNLRVHEWKKHFKIRSRS